MASFSLQPHTRTMCKQLSDPQGASNDHLGYGGVALSADGLVLAAASYKDDTKVDNGGSVLLFHAEGIAKDELGRGGVGLSGNGLFVAAASRTHTVNGSDVGCVVVWERANTSTPFPNSSSITLTDPNGAEDVNFGRGGVTLSHDGMVLATSAEKFDLAGGESGKVLIWHRPSTSTSFGDGIAPIPLFDPDGADKDNFGSGRVALSADGFILAAGSPRDSDMGDDSGSISVWESICEAGHTPPLCM
uniref:Uncharacterized protein n=1 Tax=Palpitomonas bilix TaxID=652834 RepID=A0A7S3G3L7_9EUKA|mmetsp:Transcript_23317/g.59066  ORF Transcript_23317/g.59066 Transcript_23317/m.59066 type:complete len:246 (+) Transcript_23317:405-1142(+)